MFHIKNITLSLSIMLSLIGCKSDITSITSSIEGTFTDSPVDGITYTINGVSKVTANGGKYTYFDGDTISFSLGNLELGTTKGKENITPLDMFDEEDITIYDSRVINMAKLLQSYDSDDNLENGITLSDNIKELNTSLSIDWSNDNNITNLNETIKDKQELRTTVQTLNHLKVHIPGADDPLLKYQWYIKNDGIIMNKSTVAPVKGNDLNITAVWEKYTGFNNGNPIKIQVVDTGVDMNHIDLKANIDFDNASPNNETHDANPTNIFNDTHAHGTMVAGIIGAVGWNGIGIRGIAPNSKIVPFKLEIIGEEGNLKVDEQIMNIAWASSPDAYNIDISSNSWGACYTQEPFYDNLLSANTIRAFRDGKGRIYVVSSGNDRQSDCGANTSRMKNNSYVVTVAALNDKDKYSYYSSGGANILVSAYGGGQSSKEPTIMTTTPKETNPDNAMNDVGDEYTEAFNGTSAAAPMVSGGIALVLEACPKITYQEVQYLIAKTATKVDENDTEDDSNMWFNNSAGLHFNENYGFGKLNVSGMIEMCRGNLPLIGVDQDFNSTDITINKSLNKEEQLIEMINVNSSFKARWVGLTVNWNRYDTATVKIEITSPTGTKVRLDRLGDSTGIIKNDNNSKTTIDDTIRYGAYAFMDEDVRGDWNVTITGYSYVRSLKLEIKGY